MEIKPGYKQTETGVIPEDWVAIKLGKLSTFVSSGKSKQRKEYGEYHFYGSTGIIGYCDTPEYDGERILIARVGANAGSLYTVDGRYSVSDNTLVIGLKDSNLTGYIANYLLKENLNRIVFGSGQPLVTGNQLKNVMIAMPSQREEIDSIVEAISNVVALITSLEMQIEKKKLIKQGVMQELLTGKRRLPCFSGEWETKRFGDIFQFLSTANYTREELTDTGSIKYIHYGDIHTKFENYVDLADASIPTIQDGKLKQYPLLETGDLIMVDASEDYSGVGKSVEVLNPNGIKAISGLHTILLRDISKIFADGYRAFIHSIPSVKAQLDFYATGMKVYSISKGNLAIIEIPVPPKNEQEAIVNALSSFVDEIKALEVRLAKSILLKKAMMQELLTGRIRLV